MIPIEGFWNAHQGGLGRVEAYALSLADVFPGRHRFHLEVEQGLMSAPSKYEVSILNKYEACALATYEVYD